MVITDRTRVLRRQSSLSCSGTQRKRRTDYATARKREGLGRFTPLMFPGSNGMANPHPIPSPVCWRLVPYASHGPFLGEVLSHQSSFLYDKWVTDCSSGVLGRSSHLHTKFNFDWCVPFGVLVTLCQLLTMTGSKPWEACLNLWTYLC